MPSIRSLVLGTATAAAAMLVATPASAAIVLCYEVGNDTPQCPATDSNVNVDNTTGFVVGGHLNDNPLQLLTFTGAEELVGDGSGQATISAVDDLLNSAVTFELSGAATFNAITFNLVPLTGNDPNEASSVLVSYIPAGGGLPISYTLVGSGNNFYGLYGDAGEQIKSITWYGYQPAGDGIESIKQVRLGGLQGAIPEPATWAMLLIGFGAIGATLRNKKSGAMRRMRIA